MLKARAGDHILFGLSEINMQRLRQGKPIRVDMTELGATRPLVVVIFYGETEEKMREDLADSIGPDTVLKGWPGKDS